MRNPYFYKTVVFRTENIASGSMDNLTQKNDCFVEIWISHRIPSIFQKLFFCLKSTIIASINLWKSFFSLMWLIFYEHQHFEYFSHCYAPTKWPSAGNEKKKTKISFSFRKGFQMRYYSMCECYSVIEFQLCYFLDSNFQCGHQVKKKNFFFQKIHDLVYPIQKTDWKTSTRSLSCVSVEKGEAEFTRLIIISRAIVVFCDHTSVWFYSFQCDIVLLGSVCSF